MSLLLVFLPFALLLLACAVALFVWAVKRGQFDDLETPPLRMLFDDDLVPKPAPSRIKSLSLPPQEPDKVGSHQDS